MQSGIPLILLSMSLTPFGDALSKYLGETQSPMVIVFLRYFVAGLLALVVAGTTGTRIHVPRDGRSGFVLRTALVMAAMTLLIAALSISPLVDAVGGFLIAPIVAMLISALVWGEHLTVARIGGSAISFLGALIILRPGTGFDTGMVLALSGGVCLGAFLALTRHASNAPDPVSTLVVQCLLGSAMLFPLAMFQFHGLDAGIFLPVFGLGLVTAATHFLTVLAYRRTGAATLAPFFYFNLVAAVFIGFIWFGEVPGMVSIGGVGLIGIGGLVSLVKSAKLRISA